MISIDASTLRNTLTPRLLPLHEQPQPPALPLPLAAVLVLVDETSPELPILFTVRSTSLEHHPGEIAFPGGHHEARDATLAATALREAQEEVNLPPSNVELLGYLPSSQTRSSNVWLTPTVGMLRSPWKPRLQAEEVTSYFWAPLAKLLTSPHTTTVLHVEKRDRLVHAFTIDDHIIWGVTGNIVADLLRLLGGENPPDPTVPFPIRL